MFGIVQNHKTFKRWKTCVYCFCVFERSKILHFHLLVLIALFCFVAAKSDNLHIRESIHWPNNGDRVMVSEFVYHPCEIDNNVWNFSNIRSTNKSHSIQWFNFGDSALIKIIDDKMQYVFQVIGDSILWRGYESPLFSVSDSVPPIIFTNSSDSSIRLYSPFYFKGIYSESHHADLQGNLRVGGFNRGTLIVLEDTIPDAFVISLTMNYLMRVDSGDVLSLPISQDISSLAISDTIYYWFSPNHRYPLVENRSRDYYSSGNHVLRLCHTFFCPSEEQEYSIGILRSPQIKSVNLFTINKDRNSMKNPLSEDIDIVVNPDNLFILISKTREKEYSVTISDLQGRLWYSKNVGKSGCDFFYETIDTSHYNPGIYLVNIISGDENFVKQIRIGL